MTNIYCLLNHELTPKQTEELYVSYGGEKIIYPTEQITKLWSGIPTDKELTKTQFQPVIDWLKDAKENDVLVLQGEFSATFIIADYALQKGIIPVCAVTKRVSQEVREGEKVTKNYVFEHICFRQYRYYKDLT